MRLRPVAIFWSVTIVSAMSYAICALFVAAAPEATARGFSWVMHVDLTGLNRHVTWPSFFGGMLGFSLVVGAHAGAAAWAYNRIARMREPARP